MSLLTVILVLVFVGVVLWAVDKFVPMEPSTKQMLKAIVLVIVVLWVLKLFGAFDALEKVKI